MLGLFSAADAACGGSLLRHAVADYLGATIGPWLRASAPGEIRGQLFSTAARLAYLCGFMCLTMSCIAQALDLAEAAVSSASGRTRPLTSAFLYGQLAVATAATGDRRSAISCLSTAEQFLGRASDTRLTVGVYHAASLAHQQSAVRSVLGDLPGAIAALRESVHCRPPTERRSRAITLARLAELQLNLGHLDEAVLTCHSFLDDYPAIRSARARTALLALGARLRPYAGNKAAAALLRRVSLIGQSHR